MVFVYLDEDAGEDVEHAEERLAPQRGHRDVGQQQERKQRRIPENERF